MTDFAVTNSNGNIPVVGGIGDDRLTYTYSANADGVYNYALTPSAEGGFSGSFFGSPSYLYGVGFSGIEHLTFIDLGGGSDHIFTGDGNDDLRGGGGNDWLNSGGGIDQIDGGIGSDFWVGDKSFATRAIRIDLNAPVSTYLGSGTVANVEGMDLKTGSGKDRITTSNTGMNDAIDTGAGNDQIKIWGNGVDQVEGGAGTDRLTFIYTLDDVGFYMYPLEADPAGGYKGAFYRNFESWRHSVGFSGIENFTFIDQGGGNDTIYTGDGNDVLKGGGGDDNLNSGGGIDKIDGGAGNDTWAGDKSFASKAIVIDLNVASSSYLGGGSVANVEALNLRTGTGKDRITGSMTAVMSDTIDTGAGRDQIALWGGGLDSVKGGAGSDRLTYIYDLDDVGFYMYPLEVDPDGGYKGDFFRNFESWRHGVGFDGIEHFTFIDRGADGNRINTGDGNDVIRTGGGDDILSSGGGRDQVSGGGGVDQIDGGAGNDILRGDAGGDTLNGGIGNDVLGGGGGNDTLVGDRGNDTLNGNNGKDTAVYTGNGNITVDLRKTVAQDTGQGMDTLIKVENVTSGEGDDRLTGNGARNELNGGAGNDTLAGGGNADTLIGGAGMDVLRGDAGNDMLYGGSEADRFVFDDGFGRDTIFDFQDGTDVIDLRKYAGLADFADLTIRANADGFAVIDLGSDEITLAGIGTGSLDASDFLL